MSEELAKKPKPAKSKKIRVNLTQQTVEAFEGDLVVHRFECVSGDRDHPTEPGVFTIFRKEAVYRSRTYDAQMNYAMFFTTDGKALHQYHGPMPLSMLRAVRNNITEWVGSHGCVRLSERDAKTLFEWTPHHTPVQVI